MKAPRVWNFKVRPARGGGFLAWCARADNLGDGPMDIAAHEEVHFEFGTTADEAMAKLRAEVLS
jgi:hypothetical protein